MEGLTCDVVICRYMSPAEYEGTGQEKRRALERVSQAQFLCS